MVLNYQSFLNKVIRMINKLGIDLSGAKIDHIAYQTSSSEEYNNLKLEFNKNAALIREPEVGGRRVGVFKFNKPIVYKDEKINVIELIEPKKDQNCISGLEHVEYLLPTTLEDFMQKYPNINWNTEALNREEFPMLILRLSENVQVKFPRFPVIR